AAPHLRLRIAGSPSDATVEREVRGRAASDPRVVLDLRHLSEAEFADAVLECAGVVLPYRSMHNSGAVLAALSLGRPVLVPRNEITEALAAEVGLGWIELFDAPLDGGRLQSFAEVAAQRPPTPPELSAREWTGAGAAHRSAFERAIAIRRGSRA
ncbi:MAG: glycosyl transferase, partial [Actinomycetes bacterium]